MDIFLSLIIPAFNEEKRIVRSLNAAIKYLSSKDFSFEIIVVDDGSGDNTIGIVNEYIESLESEYKNNIRIISLGANLGKGAAVRNGMLEAKGRFRVFSDADFSTPVYEIEKLLKYFSEGYDIVIGSRSIDRSMVKKHQPFYRETMGKIYNLFVQLFVFKGITDTQCGFKGFSDLATTQIFSLAKINGFSFDVELLYLSQKLGLKTKQVPVEWYNDERSTVNPITDSARMFYELLKIKRLHKTDT